MDSADVSPDGAAYAGGGTAGERGPRHVGEVTIEQVARAAGVAKSTVSRALNNPGRLNPRTQAHIHAVAQELGYRPNPVARALGTRRTSTVALLVPDLVNPFFLEVIRGAEHQAGAAGHNLILANSEEDPSREVAQIERLAGSVDGFVLASLRMRTTTVQELAARHRMVVINRQIPGVTAVVVDPVVGATTAVEHLVSLGHTEIVYASGPAVSWTNQHRWQAVRTAAKRLGATAQRLGPFAATYQSGAGAADALLAGRATAAIAFNDMIALGMLARFRDRGVPVPGQVSVIGFDDVFAARTCSPPLTTLAAPVENLGRTSVRLLLDDTTADAGRHGPVLLPSHLVVRGSTGPV